MITLIKNAKVFNSYLKSFNSVDVYYKDDKFYYLGNSNVNYDQVIDAKGKFLIPGLIDIHMHIESSMTTPSEFSKQALKFGVTTVVSDPHELANVFGISGIKEFLKSKTSLDIFYGIPSSVPSTNQKLESTGGKIGLNEVKELLKEDKILCLGEVMNFKDVVSEEDTLSKSLINESLKHNLLIEGHCPKVSDLDLAKFIYNGVDADHTEQTASSLYEKITNGMFIEIQAKSINKETIKVINDYKFYEYACLVTDDTMADKFLNGQLNLVLLKAIQNGLSIENAIYMASFTPARRMRLNDRGSISPGKLADFILLNNLEEFEIDSVYKSGKLVYKKNENIILNDEDYFSEEFLRNTLILPELTLNDFYLKSLKQQVTANIISLSSNTTMTRHLRKNLEVVDGKVDYKKHNLCLIMIVERYGNGNISYGLVENALSKKGAICTSWAHDAHNLIILGNDEALMLKAYQEIAKINGGYVVVSEEKVSTLKLNIGGIISDAKISDIGKALKDIRTHIKDLGYNHMNEIMSISTLSLPVSPELKITDKGLILTRTQEQINLFEDENFN